MAVFGHVLQVVDKFSATFQRWQTRLNVFQNTLDATIPELAVMSVAFGALAGAGAAALAKLAQSFQTVEDRLAELEIATTTTFQTMGEALQQSLADAIDFSSEFVFSTEEILSASFELAQANLNVVETQAAVRQTAFLAAGGLGELKDTALLVGQALNTVGRAGDLAFVTPMERAIKITDSIALAVRKFQATLPTFSESLKFSVGPASELGISLDELNAALGILNTAGQRGSVAGTALSNVLAHLSQATKELDLDPSRFTTATGEITSLADVLAELERRLPIGAQARFNALIEAFDIRGARAAITLLQNSDALRRHTADLNNSAGTAERYGRTFASSTNRQIEIFQNNLNNAAIKLGQVFNPVIRAAVEVLNGFAAVMSGTPELVKRLAVAAGFVVTGFAAMRAIMAAVSIALKVYAVLQAHAAAATASGAVANAAFQFSLGNVATALGTIAILSIGATIALSGFSDGVGEVGANLDTANTKFEGASSAAQRLERDFLALQKAISKPVRPDITIPEAVALADLIDVGDTRGLDAQLQKVREQIATLEIAIDFQDDSRAFQDFSKIPETFRDQFEKVLSELDIDIDAPGFQGLQLEIDELRSRAGALRQELADTQAIRDNEDAMTDLAAVVARFNDEMLRVAALRGLGDQIAEITGGARSSSAFVTEQIQKMRDLGLQARDTGVFLGSFRKQLEESLAARGITLPVDQLETFQASVERSRVALRAFAGEGFRDEFGPDFLKFQAGEFEGELQKQFEFIKDNLEAIERFDPRIAAKIKKDLIDVEGNFVELDQLLERTGDGLEQQGGFEFFTDSVRDARSVVAEISTELAGRFGGALLDATREADALAASLTLKAIIDGELLTPISQTEERIKLAEQAAAKLGDAFDARAVGDLVGLLRIQVDQIEKAAAANRLLIGEQERLIAAGNIDRSQKAEINLELSKRLQLQAQLEKQQSDLAKRAEEELATFRQLVQLRFPNLAEQLGISEGEPITLDIQLVLEQRRPVEAEIERIQSAMTLAREEATVFAQKSAQAGEEFQKFGDAGAEALAKSFSDLSKARSDLVKELEGKVVELEAKLKGITPESVASTEDTVRNAVEAAGREAELQLPAPELSVFKDGIARGLADFIATGNLDDFGLALGNSARQALTQGLSEGLAQGFRIALGFGDLAAAGKEIAELLTRAITLEGTKEGADAAAALEGVLGRLEARGENLNRVFADDQAIRILDRVRGLHEKITGAIEKETNGLVAAKSAGDQALEKLNADVASLITKFQFATGVEADFFAQLQRLARGEGIVAGVDVTQGLDSQQRAVAALRDEMRAAGLEGSEAFRELFNLAQKFNEQALSNKDTIVSRVGVQIDEAGFRTLEEKIRFLEEIQDRDISIHVQPEIVVEPGTDLFRKIQEFFSGPAEAPALEVPIKPKIDRNQLNEEFAKAAAEAHKSLAFSFDFQIGAPESFDFKPPTEVDRVTEALKATESAAESAASGISNFFKAVGTSSPDLKNLGLGFGPFNEEFLTEPLPERKVGVTLELVDPFSAEEVVRKIAPEGVQIQLKVAFDAVDVNAGLDKLITEEVAEAERRREEASGKAFQLGAMKPKTPLDEALEAAEKANAIVNILSVVGDAMKAVGEQADKTGGSIGTFFSKIVGIGDSTKDVLNEGILGFGAFNLDAINKEIESIEAKKAQISIQFKFDDLALVEELERTTGSAIDADRRRYEELKVLQEQAIENAKKLAETPITIQTQVDDTGVRQTIDLLSKKSGIADEMKSFNEEVTKAISGIDELNKKLKEARDLADPNDTANTTGGGNGLNLTIDVTVPQINVSGGGFQDAGFDSTRRDEVMREVDRMFRERVFPALESAIRRR